MIVRRILGLLLALSGLVIAQRVLDPAPIPAAGVIVGGLIPLVFGKVGKPLVIGASVGCALGALVHGYSHMSEGRAEAPLATVGHVLADAGYGAVIGGVLLIAAWLVSDWSSGRFRSGNVV